MAVVIIFHTSEGSIKVSERVYRVSLIDYQKDHVR